MRLCSFARSCLEQRPLQRYCLELPRRVCTQAATAEEARGSPTLPVDKRLTPWSPREFITIVGQGHERGLPRTDSTLYSDSR